MRIDSHQHFWSYDARQYPWIPPGSRLHRDWLPADLAVVLPDAGLQGSVAVQARQSLEETRWLLGLAERSPEILGVVGWVDLRSPGVNAELEEFAAQPKFKGVRHVVQDEPDDRFLLGEEFQRGIGFLHRWGLAYDLLVYPHQLPAATELARRFPEQPFVLDHLGKPPIARQEISPWRERILDLARLPNAFCKLSGMVTEADRLRWKPQDLEPFLEVVFEAFTTERLMYGSDWPVCLLAAEYRQVYDVIRDYTERHAPEGRAAIFGGNAARFYSLAG